MQIADWIVNINRIRYQKYYNKLIENMKNECIDGQCFHDLEKSDLHRFGITHFKDKCDILTAINQLIRNNNNISENNSILKKPLFIKVLMQDSRPGTVSNKRFKIRPKKLSSMQK